MAFGSLGTGGKGAFKRMEQLCFIKCPDKPKSFPSHDKGPHHPRQVQGQHVPGIRQLSEGKQNLDQYVD